MTDVSNAEKVERILDEMAEEASLNIFRDTGVMVCGVVVMAAIRDEREDDMIVRGRCKRCHESLEEAMMMRWMTEPDDTLDDGWVELDDE